MAKTGSHLKKFDNRWKTSRRRRIIRKMLVSVRGLAVPPLISPPGKRARVGEPHILVYIHLDRTCPDDDDEDGDVVGRRTAARSWTRGTLHPRQSVLPIREFASCPSVTEFLSSYTSQLGGAADVNVSTWFCDRGLLLWRRWLTRT